MTLFKIQEPINSLTTELKTLRENDFGNKETLIASVEQSLNELSIKFNHVELTFAQLSSLVEPTKRNNSKTLNIGGKRIIHNRSSVANSSMFSSQNMLAFLVDNNWDKFLFTDKNNCIYFDYEYEWIESLLTQSAKPQSLSKQSTCLFDLFCVKNISIPRSLPKSTSLGAFSYGIDGLSSPFKEIVLNLNNYSTIFETQLNVFIKETANYQLI
jgi:hypothetical protein